MSIRLDGSGAVAKAEAGLVEGPDAAGTMLDGLW